jgi:hypothetical protein
MRANGGLFRITAESVPRQASFAEPYRRIAVGFKRLSWRSSSAAALIIGIFVHHLEYRQPARVFNCSRTCGCPIWVGNFRELFALTEMAG